MKHFQFTLKVPGSTSNLGPGFDSIGLAINRFLTIHVESADRWDIHFTNNEIVLPDVKENLFYRAAYRVSELYKKQLPPLKIVMDSEIPLARGLGSSAAAIVGGIETANLVLELNLTLKEKGHIASCFEGHPDNATASLLGGLTISTHTDESTETIVCQAPAIDIVAMIPSFELQTKKARAVLPDQLSYKQAVEASSISNVLVAAIFQNNWVLAGKMMEKDLFHHPYRKQLVPDLVKITELGHELGAYGTILSGAGPTIISFVPKNKGEKIGQLISQKFPNYQYEVLQPISHGVITLPSNETMKLVP
ncbi:Homoserine kinase [Heyndrickxia sporothermodurans]|uniref:Homoserine kinase n=1 Tax=Heyndrickxia sporothermodurans TaxID=46224 RepID=A0A150LG79_9BACI|nr:homoserine kinase [Heyndrickxia sporothermodurans]KYD11351.1 Homoserine kinase [Heyndrickxia sporothermodurans]